MDIRTTYSELILFSVGIINVLRRSVISLIIRITLSAEYYEVVQ